MTNFKDLTIPEINKAAAELWKTVVGYENYLVSNLGRVKSIRYARHRILKQCQHIDGAMQVYLYDVNGNPKNQLVHRLVLTAFIGRCPENCEGSHLNGNPTDNSFDNLIWESHKDNLSRRTDHGTENIGSRNPMAILNESQVKLIKEMLAKGDTHGVIARRFPISPVTVCNINTGKTWRHVK